MCDYWPSVPNCEYDGYLYGLRVSVEYGSLLLMKRQPSSLKNPPVGGFLSCVSGFTLIELVLVILLLGILLIALLPKWNGGDSLDERGFRDSVISALRYAQKSAIAAHRTTCVTFTSTTASVRISGAFGASNCAAGSALAGPDGNPMQVTAKGAATFSGIPADVIFDAAGRPLSGSATLSFTGLPAALAITVAAETGYVH